MSDALLQITDCDFAYRADQPVLRDISLSVSAGRIVALLGPNGSGKSTLIRIALGHLKAGRGVVAWQGREVGKWPRRQLARLVAYLPQSPVYEPAQRVADILRMGRAPYWSAFGIESARDVQIIRQVSAMLELNDLLDRPMEELSGGQRQMVFVGRCLVQQPQALLLDEPSTFLDLKHQMQLCTLLRRLARQQNIAVLMASHDLNLAAAFTDRLVILSEGRIVTEGAPNDALNPAKLGEIYGVEMRRVETHDGLPLVHPVMRGVQ